MSTTVRTIPVQIGSAFADDAERSAWERFFVAATTGRVTACSDGGETVTDPAALADWMLAEWRKRRRRPPAEPLDGRAVWREAALAAFARTDWPEAIALECEGVAAEALGRAADVYLEAYLRRWGSDGA